MLVKFLNISCLTLTYNFDPVIVKTNFSNQTKETKSCIKTQKNFKFLFNNGLMIEELKLILSFRQEKKILDSKLLSLIDAYKNSLIRFLLIVEVVKYIFFQF